MATAKPAAKKDTNLVEIRKVNDTQIFFNQSTNQFEATIGTETVSKSTLPLMMAHVEKMNRGTRAIVIGRSVRDVKIISRSGDMLQLAAGPRINGSTATILDWDDKTFASLKSIEEGRQTAEAAYNDAMASFDKQQEDILANADKFNPATIESKADASDGAVPDADPADGDDEDDDDAGPA